MVSLRRIKGLAGRNAKFYFIDTTAMLAESHPVYSAFEVGITCMPDQVSINARLLATGLAYGGLGTIFARGRDLSRRIFKITRQTKERLQYFHDMAYTAAFNLELTPIMYSISQRLAGESFDLKQIATGAVLATFWGGINGGPLGYSVDLFRDLVGLKECSRRSYPDFIKKRSPKIKKTIAAGLVAASIGLMSLIYSLTPNEAASTGVRPPVQQTHQSSLEERALKP